MCLEDQHRDGVVLRLVVTRRSWCGRRALRAAVSQPRFVSDAAALYVTRHAHAMCAPAFCLFLVHGAFCQRLSRLLSHSSLLISSSHRTCTNHLHKPCSVIPHCLIPRNPLCRHGGEAQVSVQLVSLSVHLSLLSHLEVAEGRKLWKGLHQAHKLSLTFSNPDECV